jgi:hypothetical protein
MAPCKIPPPQQLAVLVENQPMTFLIDPSRHAAAAAAAARMGMLLEVAFLESLIKQQGMNSEVC